MFDVTRAAHAHVTRQALLTPQAVAVLHRGRELTYGELDAQSTRLARFLRGKGLVRGEIVGLSIAPSCDLVVAVLALWKAGAVYMPLEHSYPESRLLQALADTDCTRVLTQSVLSGPFQDRGLYIVYVDAERQWINQESATPLPDETGPDDTAYLMYTSGSTGKPKGVMIAHRALTNKLIHPGTWGPVTADCRAVLLASIAFDASLAQMFLPLAHGGSLVVLESHERLNPRRAWALIRDTGVNLLDCTPSWLLAMLDAAPEGLGLRRLVMGGEVLTPGFARRVRDKFPYCQLVNIYGPTEACIDATAHELSPQDFDADIVPIGQPLPGYCVQLLDAEMRPVADGQAGQLHIGGEGLAQGYWRSPEATDARFVPDPFMPGKRLYRSGDLARRRPDGCIEFLGRADHQVKLRGQRVELGEIESALAQLPGVVAAVVKAWPAQDGVEVSLAGYVVMRDAGDHSNALREQLRRQLPAHMVPAVIVSLDTLPVCATGKVDREALPAVLARRRAIDPLHEPRDDAERKLAEVWREVLEIDELGIHENFFELGGDSLSAVRLLLRVDERFGTDLPVTALLSHPTVADFAIALLRGAHEAEPSRTILLANQPMDRSPLFLLPPRTGVGLVYAALARELSGTVPTIALQAVGLSRSPPGSTSMDELAAEFIADLQRLQPSGAVRLCGYSAGGSVAHEMTRQLLRMGRPVSQLILIDPYCADLSDWPDGTQPEEKDQAFWQACRDMIGDALQVRGSAADPVLDMARQLWTVVLTQSAWNKDSPASRALFDEVRRVLPATMDIGIFLLLLEGVGNLWHAFAGHQVMPLDGFGGQAWLIQPDADPPEFRRKREARWRFLVGPGLETKLVPGEHLSMLYRARTVEAIGAYLRGVLAAENAA